MKTQWNQTTWYSKLGTIFFFLLFVPILCFYMGKLYQEVTTTQVASAGTINQIGIWSRVNISENEAKQIFTIVHSYVQKKSEAFIYYDLVIDKRQSEWIMVRVVPQVKSEKEAQVYLYKESGMWVPKSFGEPTEDLCTMYPELGC